MDGRKIRLVFMGSPGFAVPALEGLVRSGCEVAAVYTQPDRPAGRGRALLASPVKEAALRYGLAVVQPESLKAPAAAAQLAEFKPEIIVVAAYGQLLPKAVLELPPRGCVNIHPSLLPEFRGASPVAAALLAGREFTGVSIMLLDEGMDTGPLLARAAVPVSPADNTGSLTGKLSVVAAALLQDALAGWCRGEITPRPQDDAAATYSARISKEDGEIDWNQPAADIWRRVRAYNPWPGCYTRWRGKQLKIIEAIPAGAEIKAGAGQVIALDGVAAPLGVGTGEGTLGLLRVQMEGKRPVPADEFLRGQRDFIGTVLPTG
jgi:methionyl-tRNA formyltransferase